MGAEARVIGFEPIADADARVLVLGSLPSGESLKQREYFARKTNAFWPVMGRLIGAGSEVPYAERCAQLKKNGIAVWDVCHSANRPGSLDSSIDQKAMTANDFVSFFRAHPDIQCIFFNGKTAEALFRRKVLPGLAPDLASIPRIPLPSTSPAHASMRFEDKVSRWRAGLSGFMEVR